MFGVIIYTFMVFWVGSHQVKIKLFQRFELVFRVSNSESKSSPIAIISHISQFGVIIYTFIVFRVDSHQAISKIWACFQSFKQSIENVSNCNNIAYFAVWCYNQHIYGVLSWFSSSHKSSYFKDLSLFSEFQTVNRKHLQLQ